MAKRSLAAVKSDVSIRDRSDPDSRGFLDAMIALLPGAAHIPIFCGLCCGYQEDDQAALSSLFEQPPHPRLKLVQPLAQPGLKHLGLGLHHHALGLELVLEQYQFGQ